MGKKTVSVSFKNSVIDVENMTITEIGKDYSEDFDLKAILAEWHGIEGVSFSLKQDSGIPPTGSEDTEEGTESKV